MTNHEVKYNEFKQKVTNLKKVDENSNLSSEKRKKSNFESSGEKKNNKKKLELAIFCYKILHSGLFFQNRQLDKNY